MAQKLTKSYEYGMADGDKKTIKARHLDAETLVPTNDIAVWRDEVPSDKVRWWGHGTESDMPGGTAHIHADLVDDEGNELVGNLLVVIADSDGRALGERTIGDLGTLREAADESRTERPEMPAMAKHANPDRYMELRIELDEQEDVTTLDPDASELRVFYTEP